MLKTWWLNSLQNSLYLELVSKVKVDFTEKINKGLTKSISQALFVLRKYSSLIVGLCLLDIYIEILLTLCLLCEVDNLSYLRSMARNRLNSHFISSDALRIFNPRASLRLFAFECFGNILCSSHCNLIICPT